MKSSSIIIAPSILSTDLAHLQDEVDSVEQFADWLQVDVMDGHFVPNLSFGAPVIKNLKTKLPLDIHLMVSNPADRVQEFLDLKAANITFHAEAVPDTKAKLALIKEIKKDGATVGIALRPATPLTAIEDVLKEVDLVLLMTVEPGFGGQKFLPEVLDKIQELHKAHPHLMIQVDGGINEETGKHCREAGASNLVAGSYIFGAKNREVAIHALRG